MFFDAQLLTNICLLVYAKDKKEGREGGMEGREKPFWKH
jgi:hypothetical protein